MSDIRISITEDTIKRVEKILAGVPKGAPRALSNAINRGLSKARTEAVREIKKIYTVNPGEIQKNTQIQVRRANVGEIAGYVTFSGVKIPLYKFSVNPKIPGTGEKVHAVVKRGGGGTFEDGFIQKMRSSRHVGLFVREGRKRLPIEEVMGLAVAQMVGNEQVTEQMEKEAQKTVEQRIEHEITRLLNGYGG